MVTRQFEKVLSDDVIFEKKLEVRESNTKEF
jgi:hypothetical protein